MTDADAPIEVILPMTAKGTRLDKALTEIADTPGLDGHGRLR